MKKGFVCLAVVLIVLGVALFSYTMKRMDWNFFEISTDEYATSEYQVDSSFQYLFFDLETADLNFVLSTDNVCRIVCYEPETIKHEVRVENNTLRVTASDNRQWYEFISISWYDAPKVTVYLPQQAYLDLSVNISTGDIQIPSDFQFENLEIQGSTSIVSVSACVSEQLMISTSTGRIQLDGVQAGAVDLSVSTGQIDLSQVGCQGDIRLSCSTGKNTLKDVYCQNLYSTGSTGEIHMFYVTAYDTMYITRSTGDVEFKHCDGQSVTIKTSTGDVEGAFRSDKIFRVKTDTGDVDVPESVTGGVCQIETSTGAISIKTYPPVTE